MFEDKTDYYSSNLTSRCNWEHAGSHCQIDVRNNNDNNNDNNDNNCIYTAHHSQW